MFSILAKTRKDKEADSKISTKLLSFFTSKEILCVLPRVNKALKQELETTHVHLRAAAYARVLLFKHAPRTGAIITPDSFKCVKLSGGYTNFTFKGELPDGKEGCKAYISRVPGIGSNTFIDRTAEWHNACIAAGLGLNPVIVFNDKKGSQISECLLVPQPLTPTLLKERKYIAGVAEQLRTLHQSGKKFANDANIFKRNATFHAIITQKKVVLPDGYAPIKALTSKLATVFAHLDIPQVPCHNDTFYNNFLLSEGKIWLIDWEYSGNHDPIWDLAYFARLAHLSEDQKNNLLMEYFNSKNVWAEHSLDYLRFIAYGIVINEFLILWTLVQIANNNIIASDSELNGWLDHYLTDSVELMSNTAFLDAVHLLEEEAQKHLNAVAPKI
jgi:thiamine kinase-like enzyme